MDLKQLVENICLDLTSNETLSKILLKVKLYAGFSHDNSLADWVTNELEGYKDGESLPEYRKIICNVKVDGATWGGRISSYDYPLDVIKDQKISRRLSLIPIHDSINQVEGFLKKDDNLYMAIPAGVWPYLSKNLNFDIDRAYQWINSCSLNQIIAKVKSLLVDYYVNVLNDSTINFENILANKKQIIMNNTINAGIYNAGYGNVSTSNTIIGDNNCVNVNSRINDLKSIIDEIDRLLSESGEDHKECSSLIRSELDQPSPDNKILKMAFQAIKGIAFSVATQPIVTKITELVTKAISLL